MIKRIFLFVFLFITFPFIFPGYVEAKDDFSRPTITIINPIRGNGLGHESDDLLESLKAQWQVTKDEGIRATWLLQYGALENNGMTEFVKREMKDQEFGLLFEIDRNYAQKAHVQFRGQGAWYFSDGLLLNSYDRSERRMLIDTAFSKFKEIFGQYPKTLGAWWIGGDSLFYMQKKYGIIAALRAADQFDLDFYSIWGTPWNISYLSSKVNEGMPAASFKESAKVVILQWAIRDPLKGYSDATYSLQDYGVKGYTPEYVDYLASIFLQYHFCNFVMGLENGAAPEIFQQSYKTMLTKAKEIQASGKADILLARDYAQHYLTQKKVFAGGTYFLSTGYDSSDQSFWYISENYRAAVHKIKDSVYVVDMRNYINKTEEDFDILPNSQGHLRINEPDIIDSMRFPDQRILIRTTKEPLSIKEKDNEVELYAGNEKIAHFTPTGFSLYLEHTSEKTFSFNQEKLKISPAFIICIFYILYFSVVRKRFKQYLVLLFPLLIAFPLLLSSSTFLFDQKEMVFLYFISSLHLFPVLTTVYISKVLPFVILIVLHYLCRKKFFYWGYYVLLLFLYVHVPYFPLDKTTYSFVFVAFAIVALVLFTSAFLIYMKNKSKNVLLLCIGVPLIIVLSLAVIIVFSRSKLALTTYEINALQLIKSQQKSVLYVEQIDYSIRPIYKAVKPMLYTQYQIGQIMTGKKWEMIRRPDNDILNVTDYDNKVIVIPRYLGSDMSEYEIKVLNLKKIFDNAQIAVFEKI